MAEAEKVLFREVKQYRAYWRPKNYGAITIFYEEGNEEKMEQMIMESPQEFLVVTDLLRHEKPVYFSTKTGALSTGREPVGEAE
jgi:hypothetical protein